MDNSYDGIYEEQDGVFFSRKRGGEGTLRTGNRAEVRRRSKIRGKGECVYVLRIRCNGRVGRRMNITCEDSFQYINGLSALFTIWLDGGLEPCI